MSVWRADAKRCPSCKAKANNAATAARYANRVDACGNCGKPFAHARDRQDYCSPECRNSKQCERKRGHRRAAGVGCGLSLGDVLARDGGACHICGGPVDLSAPPRSPAAPTIDHVTPLSRGGKHTPENVRLAHYGCNSRKGDKVA